MASIADPDRVSFPGAMKGEGDCALTVAVHMYSPAFSISNESNAWVNVKVVPSLTRSVREINKSPLKSN